MKQLGLFTDAAVTGTRWRGQIRRVRAVLFRRIKVRGRVPPAVEIEADLDDVATKWVASLASAGIRLRRGTGQDLYDWLLKWFNPKPAIAGGDPDRADPAHPGLDAADPRALPGVERTRADKDLMADGLL